MHEPAHFVPKILIAQHVAVVIGHNNNCIVENFGLLQCGQDLANFCIKVAAISEIPASGCADFIVGGDDAVTFAASSDAKRIGVCSGRF